MARRGDRGCRNMRSIRHEVRRICGVPRGFMGLNPNAAPYKTWSFLKSARLIIFQVWSPTFWACGCVILIVLYFIWVWHAIERISDMHDTNSLFSDFVEVHVCTSLKCTPSPHSPLARVRPLSVEASNWISLPPNSRPGFIMETEFLFTLPDQHSNRDCSY